MVLFFSRTHFLSFSFILIVYHVLEAFSLNATLIFTFNNNNAGLMYSNNSTCVQVYDDDDNSLFLSGVSH